MTDHLDILHQYTYSNGDHLYKKRGGFYHLIRKDKDLFEGLEVVDCMRHSNGSFSFKTKNGDHGEVGGRLNDICIYPINDDAMTS